jgi:hypothetical protein
MATRAILKRAKGVNGKPIDFFACSICGELFKPNPSDEGEMTNLFSRHVEAAHKAKNLCEDASQAAARIVRETTRD